MNNQDFNGFSSKDEYIKVMEQAIERGLSGIVVYDKDGRFIYCNKILEILTGMPRELLELSSVEELKEREKHGSSTTLMVLEKKEEVLIEQNMVHNGKSYIAKGIPFFDENDELKYVISNIIDIPRLVDLKKKLEKNNDSVKNDKILKNMGYDQTDLDDKLLIYSSRVMQKVMEKIQMLKSSSATVLIQGESGTGKEVIAKVLHEISERRNERYVKINCGAIPEALFESELFGYASGSFTGGHAKGKKGLLEHANNGTVLLDEISEIPVNLQSKILRVLQEGELQKIGSNEPVKVDIRFIAASNLDLAELVKSGKFRSDLYYRLNVIPLVLPPLRERKEDIPPLTYHFLQKLNRKYCMQKKICNDVIIQMQKMIFKGNIRELENMIERLYFFSKSSEITVEDFLQMQTAYDSYVTEQNVGELQQLDYGRSLDEFMNSYEEKILRHYKSLYGSSRKIAGVLDVDQSTISRKFKKYNIK